MKKLWVSLQCTLGIFLAHPNLAFSQVENVIIPDFQTLKQDLAFQKGRDFAPLIKGS